MQFTMADVAAKLRAIEVNGVNQTIRVLRGCREISAKRGGA